MRKMEKLNRGLIAARAEKGIYLSWRYLGDEPDGIVWRIYRKRAEGPWEALTEIRPRDVAPESRYAENPGIVKKNTTPCCYVDPEGLESDRYAVAPVIDGAEGVREQPVLPLLEPLGTGAPGAFFLFRGFGRPGVQAGSGGFPPGKRRGLDAGGYGSAARLPGTL